MLRASTRLIDDEPATVIPPPPYGGAAPPFTFVGGCSDVQNPGVGVDKEDIKPFDTVYKDGFWHVGCYYDTLRNYGDKHGGQAGGVGYSSSVSIVRYSDFVEKE